MRASCTQPFSGHAEGCPNYNKTWSCPPNCPPLNEMKARLEACGTFYIIILRAPLPAGFKTNKAKLKSVQAMNRRMDYMLDACLDVLRRKIPGSIALFASPCSLCEREGVGTCTCPDVPCRYPDRMHYSLSSHGIDTFATLKNAGFPIETNPETSVCRIGMFCTKDATETDAIRKVCELKIKSLA
jgi:predicted metal-binding protein